MANEKIEPTVEWLTQYSNTFLGYNYGITLDVPLKFNARFKNGLGRFSYTHDTRDNTITTKCIELNKTFVESNPNKTIYAVLRHELIHYALYRLGLPFADGTPVFEAELKKHDAPSQSDMQKLASSIKCRKVTVYTYKCGCGTGETHTNLSKKQYSCGECKKPIKVLKVEQQVI